MASELEITKIYAKKLEERYSAAMSQNLNLEVQLQILLEENAALRASIEQHDKINTGSASPAHEVQHD